MYGADLLFAPIYRQGETERAVYLPEGDWVNVLTHEAFLAVKALSAMHSLMNSSLSQGRAVTLLTASE